MTETDLSPLPIRDLIEARSQDLALTRAKLVRRAGYRNIDNGIRRLESLMAGDLRLTKNLIDGFPIALDLPREVIARAIEDTRQTLLKPRLKRRRKLNGNGAQHSGLTL
jgi:hypothetical protein